MKRLFAISVAAIALSGCQNSGATSAAAINPVGTWVMQQPAGSNYSSMTVVFNADGTSRNDTIMTNGWEAHYTGSWQIENGNQLLEKTLTCRLVGDMNSHAASELRAGVGRKARSEISITGNDMSIKPFTGTYTCHFARQP